MRPLEVKCSQLSLVNSKICKIFSMIDFHKISGPKSSKQDNFQELCSQLVLREYPEAKPIEGVGGDAGLDIYEGVSPSKPKVVWQAKLFYDPIKQPQKRQIRDSFSRVANKPGLVRWILCLPRNLNPSEEEWLQGLKNLYPRLGKRSSLVFIEWWGETKLRELLLRNPDIAIEFFPSLTEQPPEKSLIVHGLSAGGQDIQFMLTNLSNNVLIISKICLEVMHWEPFDMRPGIGARVMTYKYEVKLAPKYIGEYLVTSDKFKYSKGDVDSFAITFSSPPGNKYTARLNFYCSDPRTSNEFVVSSSEFEIWFYSMSGRKRTLVLVE